MGPSGANDGDRLAVNVPSGVVVRVLGPLQVERMRDGASEAVPLSGLQRKLIARLVLSASNEVSADELIEALWGADHPRTARAALQNQVSRVRGLLGEGAIATTPAGYALEADTDAAMMADEVGRAERALLAGDARQARELAETALTRWRGEPAVELDHLADVASYRRHLDELRVGVETVRLGAALRLGESAWSVAEAERLVGEAPFDERRWTLLVQSLDLAGRRGDALGAVDRARRTLRDGLGLDLGPGLHAAEAAVLALDEVTEPGALRRLVGREEEVGEALEVIAAHRSVVVTGESGSGRSSFLDELARRARRSGVRVAHTRCSLYPATATVPLAELLGSLDESLDRSQTPVEAFVAAVARAAERWPVVVVVDDLHLAGPTTLRAVESCRSLPNVAVVSSISADQAVHDDDATVLVLAPLDRDAVVDLTSDLFIGRAEPDSATIDWLTSMSGGNPMFLECLLADPALGEQWSDGHFTSTLPGRSALNDVVRRRLDRLGTTTRGTIEVAAICGPELPAGLLDRLASPTGVAAAMASGLLVVSEDGSLRFRHGAVQRIVYADVSPGRRMDVHHTAALALLEAGHPAAVVAHHHLAAVELDPMAAATMAREAAIEAGQQGAHRDAARWYERSIEAARSLGAAGTRDLVVASIGLGDALRMAGDRDHEEILFDAADLATAIGANDLVGDAAFAVLQLGSTTESGALHTRAVELADRALAVVEDREQRAVIAAAASLAQSMSGRPDRCRSLFMQAEEDARSDDARRKVLPFAYLALGLPGDLDARERLADELLARSSAADDPVGLFEALHLRFSVGLQRASGEMVRSSLASMEAVFDRVGDVGRLWALGYQRAAVAHLDDDLDESERWAEEALGVFSSMSPSRAFAVYGSQLLVLRLAQGRIAELTETVEGLVADQPEVPAWHAALALATTGSDPERSARHAAAALEDVPNDFTWLAGHLIGGRAAALAGDDATRHEYTRRLDPWSGLVCWQGTCAYGPVDTTLAALALARGDVEAVERHADVARRLAWSLDAPVFERELDALLTAAT